MQSFRPFRISDAALVVSWVQNKRECYLWSAGRLGEYPLSCERMIETYHGVIEDSHTLWMVACEDDIPYGFVQLAYSKDDMDSVRLCFVINDPQYRGKGFGKSLLKMTTAYCFDMLGVHSISLSVFEQNEQAYHTYLAVGFSNTNHIENVTYEDEKLTRRQMVLYSSETAKAPTGGEVLEDMMIASVIKENSFAYAFQPIICASSGEIYGYEALMRAQYEGTNISPVSVLEYSAKHNMLYDIEMATLYNVMDRYENCLPAFGNRKLFINSIPGYQLTDEDYGKFKEKYSRYFPNILIEITEMNDLSDRELEVLLQRSTSDNVGLAIDDYGTGYSNTASLLKYLPDCVKLDRLLISNINEDTKKQHFVRGMVEFAHANGFKLLAEGVETSAELRTVIDMGVDLVQGYYTARPSFEIINEIPADIRNEVVSMNNVTQTADTRKIYVVGEEERELPLMRLSLEQYTGLMIANKELVLVGNRNYCAEMAIKIKDGCKCHLTFVDVYLESFKQLPCIEMGNKSELTLEIVGENRLRKSGIFVPKDSKLTIIGDGNLALRVQAIKGYGIGSDSESNFGNITWNGTGALDILVEADDGIGIGGGKSLGDAGINIKSGTVRIEPACSHSVAIGCVSDTVPITIESANVHLDLKTDRGIGIGCGAEKQNTVIANAKLNVICAGTCIAAVGSNVEESVSGDIRIDSSDVAMLGNGQKLYFVGAKSGDLNIEIVDSAVNLKGEGNEITAIGTVDDEAHVKLDHSSLTVKISSGNPKAIGASGSNYICTGGVQNMAINE